MEVAAVGSSEGLRLKIEGELSLREKLDSKFLLWFWGIRIGEEFKEGMETAEEKLYIA